MFIQIFLHTHLSKSNLTKYPALELLFDRKPPVLQYVEYWNLEFVHVYTYRVEILSIIVQHVSIIPSSLLYTFIYSMVLFPFYLSFPLSLSSTCLRCSLCLTFFSLCTTKMVPAAYRFPSTKLL